MFKTISMGIVSAFVVLGCGSTNSVKSNTLVSTTTFDKSSTDIIFKTIDKFPKNAQVSIAKIEDAKVSYYGAHNQSKSVVTINNQSSGFMIGSISKVFTSTLLAQLVLDGKLNLEESIEEKLPFSFPSDIHISYKQLANHTSGLARNPNFVQEYNSNYHEHSALDESDILRFLKNDLILSYEQNTFNYSNLGVGVLGYMLTSIENKSYENLLQERIFNTLEMHHSTTIRGDNLVPALMPNDDPVPLAYKSAGGIISTVEDMSKFTLETFSDSPAYALTQEPTFRVDSKVKMGLGWTIVKHSGIGLDLYYHGGSTEGYRSVIILDKENRNGIIVLSNLPSEGNTDAISELGRELLEEMYK